MFVKVIWYLLFSTLVQCVSAEQQTTQSNKLALPIMVLAKRHLAGLMAEIMVRLWWIHWCLCCGDIQNFCDIMRTSSRIMSFDRVYFRENILHFRERGQLFAPDKHLIELRSNWKGSKQSYFMQSMRTEVWITNDIADTVNCKSKVGHTNIWRILNSRRTSSGMSLAIQFPGGKARNYLGLDAWPARGNSCQLSTKPRTKCKQLYLGIHRDFPGRWWFANVCACNLLRLTWAHHLSLSNLPLYNLSEKTIFESNINDRPTEDVCQSERKLYSRIRNICEKYVSSYIVYSHICTVWQRHFASITTLHETRMWNERCITETSVWYDTRSTMGDTRDMFIQRSNMWNCRYFIVTLAMNVTDVWYRRYLSFISP